MLHIYMSFYNVSKKKSITTAACDVELAFFLPF